MPDFSIEQTHAKLIVAGIDEAGRGPWAGPVVAAAVLMWKGAVPQSFPAAINDSKKLSAAQRERLYGEITSAFEFGVGIVEREEIDTLNIWGATKLAMRIAVEKLPTRPALALIDGPHVPELPCRAQPVIGGDGLSISIAAASIIAKVTRDRIMRELHREFPHYGWDSNAGYGTKAHQEGLQKHGITPYHRRSFRPIKELLEVIREKAVYEGI